jgi:hypothetical protein
VRKYKYQPVHAGVFAAFLVTCLILVPRLLNQGEDFQIVWMAARSVFDGRSPYTVSFGGIFQFKYPPWILPIYFPFALFSLFWAKLLWGVLEVGCLFYSVAWVIRNGCKPGLAVASTVAFFGIWSVHFMAGQISLLTLALLLSNHLFAKIWASTAKIFSVFVLLGISDWKKRKKEFLKFAYIFLGLSFPVVAVATYDQGFLGFIRGWLGSTSAGAQAFTYQTLRGGENQGFPALVLRILHVPTAYVWADLLATLAAFTVVAWFWKKQSRKLPAAEQWAGWLGLGTTILPLAWFSSFVWAYPLAALSLQKAWKTQQAQWLGAALFGVIAISSLSHGGLGQVGEYLELASIKSIGVLCCALVLAKARGGR